jgi:hypothetical protein
MKSSISSRLARRPPIRHLAPENIPDSDSISTGDHRTCQGLEIPCTSVFACKTFVAVCNLPGRIV